MYVMRTNALTNSALVKGLGPALDQGRGREMRRGSDLERTGRVTRGDPSRVYSYVPLTGSDYFWVLFQLYGSRFHAHLFLMLLTYPTT